ncbi:hypothetical protein [Magnetofaba australis]|nr:hypothetical protein [Magnetofaba australis]
MYPTNRFFTWEEMQEDPDLRRQAEQMYVDLRGPALAEKITYPGAHPITQGNLKARGEFQSANLLDQQTFNTVAANMAGQRADDQGVVMGYEGPSTRDREGIRLTYTDENVPPVGWDDPTPRGHFAGAQAPAVPAQVPEETLAAALPHLARPGWPGAAPAAPLQQAGAQGGAPVAPSHPFAPQTQPNAQPPAAPVPLNDLSAYKPPLPFAPTAQQAAVQPAPNLAAAKPPLPFAPTAPQQAAPQPSAPTPDLSAYKPPLPFASVTQPATTPAALPPQANGSLLQPGARAPALAQEQLFNMMQMATLQPGSAEHQALQNRQQEIAAQMQPPSNSLEDLLQQPQRPWDGDIRPAPSQFEEFRQDARDAIGGVWDGATFGQFSEWMNSGENGPRVRTDTPLYQGARDISDVATLFVGGAGLLKGGAKLGAWSAEQAGNWLPRLLNTGAYIAETAGENALLDASKRSAEILTGQNTTDAQGQPAHGLPAEVKAMADATLAADAQGQRNIGNTQQAARLDRTGKQLSYANATLAYNDAIAAGKSRTEASGEFAKALLADKLGEKALQLTEKYWRVLPNPLEKGIGAGLTSWIGSKATNSLLSDSPNNEYEEEYGYYVAP